VIVGDLHVTYKEFQESMKKYCDISETLMAVYCEVFNGRPEKYLFDKDNRKKISFSPFFTKKLLVTPLFKSSECIDELKQLNNVLNIKSADLVFFPVII
jgi:hypothetical protein